MATESSISARAGSVEATVSTRVVRGLVELVERAGVARGELLRAAGIDAEQVEEAEGRLLRSDLYKLCELALDLTGDPALGLHWAEGLRGSSFVPVSHLIAHSASLGQGFESLSQFVRLLSDEPGFAFLEEADQVTVRCLNRAGDSPRLQRFLAEMIVAGFYRIIRSFCPGARPQVSFAYAAPAYHQEYTRVFEHATRFEQLFSGVTFERALLNAASPHEDEGVHEALRTLAERRMSSLTQRVPYAQRVRELLVQRGGPHRIDMQSIARTLELSVRSLRRRLSSEGKSYNDVENDALAIVAKHLLGDKQRTIQETAYEMGFSDTTAFHRAFKRCTGMTPGAYRKTAREC